MYTETIRPALYVNVIDSNVVCAPRWRRYGGQHGRTVRRDSQLRPAGARPVAAGHPDGPRRVRGLRVHAPAVPHRPLQRKPFAPPRQAPGEWPRLHREEGPAPENADVGPIDAEGREGHPQPLAPPGRGPARGGGVGRPVPDAGTGRRPLEQISLVLSTLQDAPKEHLTAECTENTETIRRTAR